MSNWYKDNKEYTENEIRALNPNTLYGTPFSPEGYAAILETPQPTITELEVAVHNSSTIDALGNRVRVWAVQNKFSTPEQVEVYLAQRKAEKIQAIISNANLSAPVTIGLVTYNGGDSSAGAIMGGIDLANLNQEPNMAIWDINNYVRTYSIAEAMSIVNTIALAYRSNALARQNKIMAVNAITIDPQGLYPTYESAKTALDLITV